MEIIGLASDHAGYDLKCLIKEHLEKEGYKIKNYGCPSSLSCDYRDFAHPFAHDIECESFNRGFVFCGSGNGINMTVNKHQGIRSAICWNAEVAKLARNHNNANVCSFPARFITFDDAIKITDIFLTEQFDGGRYENRVEKIPLPK